MLRDDRWVFIQYGEDAERGIELFDMQNDPLQYTNLATDLTWTNSSSRSKN
jgi:iduronate 2-sulfatase